MNVQVSAMHVLTRSYRLILDRFLSRGPVVLLFCADGLGFGVWAGLIPHFQQQLRLSAPQLGVPLLALIFGAMSSMPIAGSVIARYGSIRVAVPAALAYALALTTIAWAAAGANTLFFTLAVFGFGCAKGMLDVTVNAQAVLLEKIRLRPLNAFCQGCWSLGGLTGSGLVVLLTRREGCVFGFVLVVSITIGTAVLLLRRRLVDDRVTDAVSSGPGQVRPGVLAALSSSSRLRALSGLAVLAFFVEGVMTDWAAVYLRTSIGLSAASAAVGYTVYAFAMTTGRLAGDGVIRRFGPVAVLRGGGVLMISGVVVAVVSGAWLHWREGIMVGFVVVGLGLANLVPVIFSAAGRGPVAGPGPGIATVTTLGFGGFLLEPPTVAAMSAGVGLSVALLLVVVAGATIVVVAPLVTERRAPIPDS